MRSVFLLGIAFLLMGCSEDNTSANDPLVVAHRGVSYAYPENTQQSFDAAKAQEIESVEFDIVLTKDDSVMIFHDLEVGRLTDLTGDILDYTAQEIKAGIARTSGGTGMTANEFFKRYGTSFTTVFVEIKEGQDVAKQAILIRQLSEIVRANNLESNVVATCTGSAPIDSLQSINSMFQVAKEVREEAELPAQLKKYKRVLISFELLSPAMYQTVHTAGGSLITFTPNTTAEYEKALSYGCDVIMTDNPLALKRYLLARH